MQELVAQGVIQLVKNLWIPFHAEHCSTNCCRREVRWLTIRDRGRKIPEPLSAGDQPLNLGQMVQVVAGHGFHNRLKGHGAALRMGNLDTRMLWQSIRQQKKIPAAEGSEGSHGRGLPITLFFRRWMGFRG